MSPTYDYDTEKKKSDAMLATMFAATPATQPPPAVGSSEWVAAAVARMAKQNEDLRALLGFVLATIRVNRLRGSITSADEKDFDRLEEGWRAEFARINAPAATGKLSEPAGGGGVA